MQTFVNFANQANALNNQNRFVTQAFPENGGGLTTFAEGEEGGGLNPPITTQAVGEEGGFDLTTFAEGEEGGQGNGGFPFGTDEFLSYLYTAERNFGGGIANRQFTPFEVGSQLRLYQAAKLKLDLFGRLFDLGGNGSIFGQLTGFLGRNIQIGNLLLQNFNALSRTTDNNGSSITQNDLLAAAIRDGDVQNISRRDLAPLPLVLEIAKRFLN